MQLCFFLIEYFVLMLVMFVFYKRVLMLVMKGVRVASRLMMIVTGSNFMGGMVLYKDSFKGHSIMCSIVDRLK